MSDCYFFVKIKSIDRIRTNIYESVSLRLPVFCNSVSVCIFFNLKGSLAESDRQNSAPFLCLDVLYDVNTQVVESCTLLVAVLLMHLIVHLLVGLSFSANIALPLLLKLELLIDQSDSLTLLDNQLVLLVLIVVFFSIAGSKLLLESLQI